MAKYRKKLLVPDNIEYEATQWFKNGDHPEDNCEIIKPDPNGVTQFEPFLSEGKVVRYFRRPDIPGEKLCEYCHQKMHNHGWIDASEEDNPIVCPGDFIITGSDGTYHPCNADIFKGAYEKIDD